ncbi:MAG: tetratricopeptide repeat protein, partial [Chitinophagaceae bacterium]
MPYNTDTWNEYWYPFQNTDGVALADLNGVFNVKKMQHSDSILISPVSYIHDTLKVWNEKNRIIFKKMISLQPLQSFKQNISLQDGEQIGKILIAGSEVNFMDSAERVLDRPVEPDSNFNWKSAYGLYLSGRYDAGTRHYESAMKFIDSSLHKEPYFIPALSLMSCLQYRKMNYDRAFYFAKNALSIDTYDPASNYYYGLAAWKLGKWYDAMDGFEVAALTSEFRSAAYTEMSKLQILKQDYQDAYNLATESLVNNTKNITGLQLQYIAARYLNKKDALQEIKQRILELDPLNNFVRFENYWNDKTSGNKEHFTGLIKDELPRQTYLNLADWYLQLGVNERAKSVLAAAPEKDDEMKYWLAYLHRNDENAQQWLDSANAGSP